MGRRIVTSQMQKVGAGAVQIDTYFDKLIKYIPADLVAAWTAVSGLIAGSSEGTKPTLLWISFFVGLVLTAAWTFKQTSQAKLPPATIQIIISTIAFAVWVFALGGPFAYMSWYSPIYGSLLIIAYTLIVPLINP